MRHMLIICSVIVSMAFFTEKAIAYEQQPWIQKFEQARNQVNQKTRQNLLKSLLTDLRLKLRSNPQNKEFFLRLSAKVCIALEKYKKAERFLRYLQARSNRAEYNSLLSRVLLKQNKLRLALDYNEKVLNSVHRRFSDELLHCEILSQIDDSKGFNCYRNLSIEYSKRAEPHFKMAYVYFKRKRYNKSIETLEKGLMLNRFNLAAIRFMSKVCAIAQKYQKALEYNIQAKMLSTDNFEIIEENIQLYHKLEKYAEAEASIAKLRNLQKRKYQDLTFFKREIIERPPITIYSLESFHEKEKFIFKVTGKKENKPLLILYHHSGHVYQRKKFRFKLSANLGYLTVREKIIELIKKNVLKAKP